MKQNFLLKFLAFLTLASGFSQVNTNERAKWFTDARFVMLIHWGIDRYRSFRLGELDFPETGIHE